MKKTLMVKRLNDDETVLLISFVHSKECLWDENHADFKRISVTRRLWSEIGVQLSITGEEAKCKWKNLKDKFKKILRKNPDHDKEPETDDATAPSWKFYNSMLFLKEGLSSKFSTYNNVPIANGPTPEPGCSGQHRQNQANEDFEEYNCDFLVRHTPDREFQPRLSSCGVKRKNINDGKIVEEDGEPEEKKIPVTSFQIHQGEIQKNDDYLFLLSILPYIQALDPIEKLELRSKVQNLVTDSYREHKNRKCTTLRH